MMPELSATREMLNASARRSGGDRSVIIALLAVMNCAQPKAASRAMSATTIHSVRVTPRPMNSVMLPHMATISTGRRPQRSHRAPPTTCMGNAANRVMPRMRPTAVIDRPSSRSR